MSRFLLISIIRFMKKLNLLIISVALLLMISSCSDKEAVTVKRDISFFYMELCPGCESYAAAERISGEVLKFGGTALNIIHDEDAQAMKELLESKEMGNLSHVLPLLIIEDRYVVGYEEIEEEVGKFSKE